MDELIGWVLVALGVFIEINIYRAKLDRRGGNGFWVFSFCGQSERALKRHCEVGDGVASSFLLAMTKLLIYFLLRKRNRTGFPDHGYFDLAGIGHFCLDAV